MSRGTVVKFIIEDTAPVYNENIFKTVLWGFNDDDYNHPMYVSFGKIDDIEASDKLLHISYFTLELCEKCDKYNSHNIPENVVTMTFKAKANKDWTAINKKYLKGEIRAIDRNEQYFGDTICFEAHIDWDWERRSDPNQYMIELCKDVNGEKGSYFDELYGVIRKAYQGDKLKNRMGVKLIFTDAKYIKPFNDTSRMRIWVKKNKETNNECDN